MKDGLGAGGEDYLMEKRLLMTSVILAMVASACASGGDVPAEDQAPSTTAPADLTADSPTPGTDSPGEGLGMAEDPGEEFGAEGSSGGDPEQVYPPDNTANLQEGTPNETRDPEVAITRPTLPDAAFSDGWPSQPNYPDVEIVVPPPRD
jgi:hypothetical protein